jgi:hypothetical protein
MNEELRYRGLSLSRDELAVKNGELAMCGGVELHDGALRPSVLTGTDLKTPLTNNDADNPQVVTLKYVHTTTSYTHLIGTLTVPDQYIPDAQVCQMYWYQSDGTFGGLVKQFADGVTIQDVQSVGNTLVIIASDGLHYILWKNTDNLYKYLGQKPPFVTLIFDPSENRSGDYESGGIDASGSEAGFWEAFQQTSVSCGDMFTTVTKTTAYAAGDKALSIKSDQQSPATEAVWALINRTNDFIAKQGHFYASFFVRYCYRMYDGSMVMHSAPVFMPVLVPDSYQVYVANAHTSADGMTVGLDDTIKIKRKDSSNNDLFFNINKCTFMYHPRNVALTYRIYDDTACIALQDWADIIKSVDVFVSAPVTRVDSALAVKSCSIESRNYCRGGVFQDTFIYNDTQPTNITVDMPGLSNTGLADKIVNTSTFYKVHSFKLEDMKLTGSTDVPVDKTAVANIATQEQMIDDYKSHNLLFATGAYVYNHRLNLFDVKEKLFTGFNDKQMLVGDTTLNPDTLRIAINKIVVRLNTEEGYKFVEVLGFDNTTIIADSYTVFNLPKFYPDARADKMYISYNITGESSYIVQFDMVAAHELNGAFAIGDFSDNYTPSHLDSFQYTVDDVVNLPNKIYTSELNNPFYFPIAGINTVGMGTIKGLAAATRALSQGQFGQYPLMAFATDGIWALQVSETGTYSSIHPISREVCDNAASIAQLDQSVVFATDRSMNKVVESSVVSFSDILDGPFFDVRKELPSLAALFDSGGKYESKNIQELMDFSTPPIEYFRSGRVLYDFANNRLIVMPSVPAQGDVTDGREVVYVYSIRDDAWSTMVIDTPLVVLNSYPYPYLQRYDGSVMRLDKKYDYTEPSKYDGLVVTRTLTFKGIMQAISGFAQLGNASTPALFVLFGSNDNRTWHYIGRSARDHANYLPGHSYRFFRIALYLQMSQGEAFFQTNLEITDKYAKL